MLWQACTIIDFCIFVAWYIYIMYCCNLVHWASYHYTVSLFGSNYFLVLNSSLLRKQHSFLLCSVTVYNFLHFDQLWFSVMVFICCKEKLL